MQHIHDQSQEHRQTASPVVDRQHGSSNELKQTERSTIDLANRVDEAIESDHHSSQRAVDQLASRTAAPVDVRQLHEDVRNCYSEAKQLNDTLKNAVVTVQSQNFTSAHELRQAQAIADSANNAIRAVHRIENQTTQQIQALSPDRIAEVQRITTSCLMKLRTTSEDFIQAVKNHSR
jgi:hypothetical protein